MHEQITHPTDKTGKWPANDVAPEGRVSPTIWFGPEMSWGVAPTGQA